MSILLFGISSTSVLSKLEQIVTLMMDVQPPLHSPSHGLGSLHALLFLPPCLQLPMDSWVGGVDQSDNRVHPFSSRAPRTSTQADFINTVKLLFFFGLSRHKLVLTFFFFLFFLVCQKEASFMNNTLQVKTSDVWQITTYVSVKGRRRFQRLEDSTPPGESEAAAMFYTWCRHSRGASHPKNEIRVRWGTVVVWCHPATDIKSVNIERNEENPVWSL